VDTAARVQYLTLQPSPKVRKFLIKYQDRVLYGTDTEIMPDSNVDKVLSDLQDTYALDWKYFATKETFDYKGHKVTGLALPKPVLRKLYHENAVHWFPGILAEPANVNSQR
jgi:predicted TIM-barrel fold metal-dependent hydrolase